uniref:Uncharacterized protein n=1 Tax=viral metagenome TaxID=1070528 RepID=A0A6M3JCY3_9ZZZZ
MLGLGLMLGSMGLDIFGNIMGGKEEERQAKWEAEQRLLQIRYIKDVAREKTHGLARESTFAKGSAMATVAKSGVKVGTGSANTLIGMIENTYAERMKEIGMETSYQVSSLTREAEELKRRGKKAKEASYWELGASLLGKSYTMGTSEGWWGAMA